MNPIRRSLITLGLLVVAASRLSADEPQRATDKVRLFNDLTVRSSETVAGDAVALMGDVVVDAGRPAASVQRSVIAVFGDCVVNGAVHGSVTAIRGDVILGPTASVDGNVTARGGQVHRDAKAAVAGRVSELPLRSVEGLSPGLAAWIDRGLYRGRLLAPSAHSRALWIGVVASLALAVVVSALFSGPVRLCGETLLRRPGLSAVAGLFGLAGIPVILGLLCLSVVGIPIALLLLPLVTAAILGIGGTAVLKVLGQAVLRGRLPSAASVAVGGVIVLGLGLVPFAGLALVGLTAFAGLGALVGTLVVPALASEDAASVLKAGLATQGLPRASFGLRVVAGLVDLILIVCATALVGHMTAHRFAIEPVAFALAFFTIYSAAMWRWNGATVGALLCGIRIVRIDDRPMDWTTSIVRVLGSQLSLAVFGLGFLTVGLGKGRLAWHDRMAGTMAIRA